MIKVLVVDDSALMRKLIREILESDPEIEVVGTARNGLDALKKIEELDPDVVTLDINMPVMDGKEALKEIMVRFPRPVVIVSSLTQDDAPLTFELLDMGAVDYIPKPSGTISLDIKKVADEIIQKVKNAFKAGFYKIRKAKRVEFIKEKLKPEKVAKYTVAIGISTGGPKTLLDILQDVNPDPDTCYLVVQHMPPQFTPSLAERLDRYTPIHFVHARNGEPVLGGKGYLAPGGWHLTVSEDLKIRLTKNPADTLFRPSVDVLFFSVAEIFGPKTVGVILTGIGSDGAKGLLEIRKKGGITIAESEETAVVFGMPRSAIEIGAALIVAPSYEIPREIKKALFRIKRRVPHEKSVVGGG